MRNLRNIRYSICETESDITALCWDASTDEVLVTYGPSEGSHSQISLVRIADDASSSELQCRTLASWDVSSPRPNLPVDKVVSLHHFSGTLTTCIVLAGGDIVVVEEGEAHIEIVGSIDAGITAARWSPDEELLVIATEANTVVFMSRSFDGVAEATMRAEDLKASKHVSVGWGKKETQFQGKGAKALRDPTIPEKVDEGTLSPHDDGRTTISWRGDGAFVAVNTVEARSRRVIRVYNREAVLDSVSEPVDGLEGSLSWRPAGNLIAGTQRLTTGEVDVVFFERNGLRHGQFRLRLPRALDGIQNHAISLGWNSDSTVLAVLLPDAIQLWTMGNYHWYLKQEIPLSDGGVRLSWHPEKSLMFTASANERLLLTELIFTTARGSLVPPNDHGAVAVIDGETLKLTPFRAANIPPPMSMFDIRTRSSIVDVAYSADNSTIAVLHNSELELYAWQRKGDRFLVPKPLSKVSIAATSSRDDKVSLQVCFSGRNEVAVLYFNEELRISSYTFDGATSELELRTEQTSMSVSSIATFRNAETLAYFQERSGKLVGLGGCEAKETLPSKLPVQLPWTEAVADSDGYAIVFGLSRSGHLYANSRLLAKSCTSFLVTQDHLIFTTNNHFVKFVHLQAVEGLEVPPDNPETDERCRSIERGARLVTAVPTDMNLVLQMPRGNLETIFPRAMVIAGIRQLIDEKNYGRAFSYCRTQRVDMNLLYDHRPQQFLSSVGMFLDQLKDPTYIDLFLSSLREEDIAETMYRDTRPQTSQHAPGANRKFDEGTTSDQIPKVNTICDAVLRSLRARKNANLQNIITANVCKIPPALDDGLLVVAELMQEDEGLAERAVEHICFLVDVNRLYDHALGLYNLDLALLVAQQSQRDPREYLPFIQNLHRMPEPRRRFAIDDHLEHYDKALGYLRALKAFDEVCTYTAKHKLYQAALRLYRYEEEQYRILTDLYAAHLESISKFKEAGLAYESLGNFSKASTCYRTAGPASWRECLFAAQMQTPPAPASAIADLATSLADALSEAKDHAAAAAIHLEHLGSVDAAVRSLCRGHNFADAMRLAALYSRLDLLAAAVDPALVDALSATTELLADCRAQLAAQVPRVLELRRRAAEDPLAFYEGERRHGADGDVPDDVSVAASEAPSRLSTSASLFTRYTGKGGGSVGTAATGASRATSKNRRREEKKRARGRKGTVYEEEYLVNSVARLAARVEATRGEVEALVVALARRAMGERARAVEALMAEVIERCRAAVGTLWPEGAGTEQGGRDAGGDGPVVGEGGIEDGVGERRAGQQMRPVVSDLKRLSLLG